MRAVGQEVYEISPVGDSYLLKSDFDYTERGFHVSLASSLRFSKDGTPERFES